MTRPQRTRLNDGTSVFCLSRQEALVLDSHVDGYLRHGITIEPGAVIIDAGANIGLFGLRALLRCGGQATVLACEPVPPIFNVLAHNAARHSAQQFRAFCCGLSSRAGTAELTYYPRAPALSTAHPEIYDEDRELLPRGVLGTARHAPAGMKWARWLPASLCRAVASLLQSGAQRFHCELRTISDIIQQNALSRVDLLKIDVEGEELEVLRGIAPEHWPLIRQIVVEVHDRAGRLAAVRGLLREHGLLRQHVAQEEAFATSPFFNVYARRE